MCGSDQKNFLYVSAYLLAHIEFREVISGCSPAYNDAVMDFASLLEMIAILSLLRHNGVAIEMLGRLLGWLTALMVYYTVKVSLVIFTAPVRACPSVLITIDTVVVTFFLTFIVLFICMILLFLVGQCLGRLRRRQAEKELVNIYQNIFRDDFDIQGFLRKYAEVVDRFGMKEQDLAVMRDVYVTPVDDNRLQQLRENAVECAICLGQFELEDQIITHPGCIHTYHWECLAGWLARPDFSCFCPQCKKPTMSTMLAEIREKFRQKHQMRELQEVAGPPAQPV